MPIYILIRKFLGPHVYRVKATYTGETFLCPQLSIVDDYFTGLCNLFSLEPKIEMNEKDRTCLSVSKSNDKLSVLERNYNIILPYFCIENNGKV